ncbi:MAG TPA: hypothetical protein VEA99_19175 [Gemmatimonadaceae bacterium]|nr:hypothetical protein [Gemmatimonadaceae bacterium]
MALPVTTSRSAEHVSTAPHPATAPRPRLLDGGVLRLDQAVEEQRLSRLGTEVLRQLVTLGTPSIAVLARYLGVSEGEVLCCAEGVQRLPRATRRNLARVALAFAPSGVRHTAKRLLEGELARLAPR